MDVTIRKRITFANIAECGSFFYAFLTGDKILLPAHLIQKTYENSAYK